MIVKMESTIDKTVEVDEIHIENDEKQVIYDNLDLSDDVNIQTDTIKDNVQNYEQAKADMVEVGSEQELHQGDTSSLLEHNQLYTLLLEAYVRDFQRNSLNKSENKQTLFAIAMILLIMIPMLSFLIIATTLLCMSLGRITVLESLPELVTALVAFLGTFMVIPKMITKYLFNKNEEKHLATIISKIQSYDRDIRGGL